MNTKLTTAMFCLGMLMVLPLAGAIGSAAHPHAHNFVGTSTQNVDVTVNEEVGPLHQKLKVRSAATPVGVCQDVTPIARLTPLPPEVIRDADPENGVGGACFPFVTTYGDDTGSTLNVYVSESDNFFAPVWIACVDSDGDGVCFESGGADQFNLCWTGGSPVGSVSLISGGACSIYADPMATLNPNVYVFIIGAISIEDGAFVQDAALRGSVYYG